MWQCICGQARRTEPSHLSTLRTEPSTLQNPLHYTEHLAGIFIDQNQFLFEVEIGKCKEMPTPQTEGWEKTKMTLR